MSREPPPQLGAGDGGGLLDEGDRTLLLATAAGAIAAGLQRGRSGTLPDADCPARLRAPGASFVSLHQAGALRGCIGSLEALHPLIEDVARNAFAAAFRDPRFAPLAAGELQALSLHIAVLSPPEAVAVDSERALLALLRPGVDGLVLQEAGRRATFLPAVWASLPDPAQFVRQLKIKAGLDADHWSPTLRVQRYTVVEFAGAAGELLQD